MTGKAEPESTRLSGYGESAIGIEFIGLRPGEELYEELLADGEHTLPTPHSKLRIASPRAAPDVRWLEELLHWLQQGNPGAYLLRRELAERVPEYVRKSNNPMQNELCNRPI